MNIKKHFSAAHLSVLSSLLAIAIFSSYLASPKLIMFFAINLIVLAGYCYLLRDKIISLKMAIFFVCITVAITLVIVVPAFFRPATGILGFQWKIYSEVGQYLGLFTTFGIPFVISTLILSWFSNKKIHSVVAMSAAFISGSLFIIPLLPSSPGWWISVIEFVLLVLACVITRTCL